MRYELNIESEPFETHSEFGEASETLETELADWEWEEEATRRQRPRVAVPSARTGGQFVSAGRRIKSPFRPPVRPLRPVIFPTIAWPPVSVVEPRPPQPPAPAGAEPKGGAPAPAGGPPSEPGAEPSAEGSEHVRWVQSALNDVLGLRLPLHGIMDAATRSAVRSFQQREGLPVDGIVGPDTERALIAARSGKSPRAGATRPVEPGMVTPPALATTPPAAEFDFEWDNFAYEREPDFSGYEYEQGKAEKIIEDFLAKVRNSPKNFKKLLLIANFHIWPTASKYIKDYSVTRDFTIGDLVTSGSTMKRVDVELYQISNAFRQQNPGFRRQVEDEEKHLYELWITTGNLLSSKNSWPFLVDAALMDSIEEWYKSGLNFAQKALPTKVSQWIINSEASEAHLTNLGQYLHKRAKALEGANVPFKAEVDRERKKREQAWEEQRKQESRCVYTKAVIKFSPGKAVLDGPIRKQIETIAKDISVLLRSELGRQKGKVSDVTLRPIIEGHVDKTTDPKNFGKLDEERASNVASELSDMIPKKLSDLLGGGIGLLFSPTVLGAGTTRPISRTSPEKNRRVVVCLRLKFR